MIITLRNLQRRVLISPAWVEKLIKNIGEHTDTEDYDIAVWLVDNAYTQKLNKEERDKDKPADILSVPLHPDNPPGKPPPELGSVYDIGDIYVSLEMLKQQASERQIDFDEHLKKILIHGYCHLLGYDHETDSDFDLMMKEEDRLYDAIKELKKE